MTAGRDSDGDILLVYTGGTFGSLPQDPADPLSPLVPASLTRVLQLLPYYDRDSRSLPLAGTSIRLDSYSWDVPVDSSNITPSDWQHLASVISENSRQYVGFVILHGTDTLAYTASALAFLLVDLDRPVILTGSQRPIGQPRSDAVQNLIASLELAAAKVLGAPVVPEVGIYFGDRLLRGCRATKISATSFRAFDSPNCPPLATAGEQIAVNSDVVARPSARGVYMRPDLEPGIACVTIFPGMTGDVLTALLSAPGLRGVVLQTFGTGNTPTAPSFLEAIERAVRNGLVVVDISQCRSGEVELGLYGGSAALLARGVIGGMDMTPEAALAKLAWVLADESDRVRAEDRFQLNLRGEQRRSVFYLHFGGRELGPHEVASLKPVRPMVAGYERYDPMALQRAVVRVLGLSVPREGAGTLAFTVHLGSARTAGRVGAGQEILVGEAARAWVDSDGKANAIFECTKAARVLVDHRSETTVTVRTQGRAVAWEKLDLALYADC